MFFRETCGQSCQKTLKIKKNKKYMQQNQLKLPKPNTPLSIKNLKNPKE